MAVAVLPDDALEKFSTVGEWVMNGGIFVLVEDSPFALAKELMDTRKKLYEISFKQLLQQSVPGTYPVRMTLLISADIFSRNKN
jgi:hypothetical protein